MLEVGATRAVTDGGDELSLRLRLVDLRTIGPQFLLGYRGYFGYEEFKTFFLADLFATTAPIWGLGAHVGLGAQYDFNRIVGLFVQLGAGVTLGRVVFTGADLSLGAQLRF